MAMGLTREERRACRAVSVADSATRASVSVLTCSVTLEPGRIGCFAT